MFCYRLVIKQSIIALGQVAIRQIVQKYEKTTTRKDSYLLQSKGRGCGVVLQVVREVGLMDLGPRVLDPARQGICRRRRPLGHGSWVLCSCTGKGRRVRREGRWREWPGGGTVTRLPDRTTTTRETRTTVARGRTGEGRRERAPARER